MKSRTAQPILFAKKPETFSLPSIQKFEKPPRALPPVDVPASAIVQDVKKRRSLPRALAAALISGVIAAALFVAFIFIVAVDMVPAALFSLILFVGFWILTYNFLETAG